MIETLEDSEKVLLSKFYEKRLGGWMSSDVAAFRAMSDPIEEEFPGTLMVPPAVADTAEFAVLSEKAAVFEPAEVTSMSGDVSRCHRNAASWWANTSPEDPSAQIATGFALSDGLWRSHSWGVSGGLLVETTEPRDRYWGVVLGDVGSALFARNEGVSVSVEAAATNSWLDLASTP